SASDGKVSLTWDAPSDDGGSSISDYKIYRGTSSGQLSHYATTGSTSYTDSSVTNGQDYYYKVSAVNSEGEGPKSSEVSATPESSGENTVPSEPVNVRAEMIDGSITLTWNPPADDGGSAVSQYKVYWTTSSIFFHYTYKVSGTSFTLDNVDEGETYIFRVSAINSVGEGPKSDKVYLNTDNVGSMLDFTTIGVHHTWMETEHSLDAAMIDLRVRL
ncbi:MAG: fibronectin type III domain-containing protein, partial [Methanomassiliicoccales archaeon]